MRAPFFGANYWIAVCKPVPGGGIPPTHSSVELRLTFREGGAFDFHTTFEQIKERLHQAQSVAQDLGQIGVNAADVHLEQLPAYEAAGDIGNKHVGSSSQGLGNSSIGGGSSARSESAHAPPRQEVFASPDEPPPGYEEAQAQAVDIHLGERLRDEAARQ